VIVEALSPTAERIFDSLPPYYQGEPTLSRITQAVANELDRLQAYLQAVASGLVPKLSDDTLSMLGIWENILKLPVEPAGVSVEQRQQALQAAFTARQCRTTAEWVNAMNIALGGATWRHQVGVPAPGWITITMATTPSSYVLGILQTLMDRLVPANYQVVFATQAGFIVGVSRVGDLIGSGSVGGGRSAADVSLTSDSGSRHNAGRTASDISLSSDALTGTGQPVGPPLQSSTVPLGTGTTTTVTLPNVTAGHTLTMMIFNGVHANGATSITGGGTWTHRGTALSGSGTGTIELWDCTATGGATSALITFPTAIGSASGDATLSEFTPMVFDQFQSGTGTGSTSYSVSVTPAVAKELFLAGAATQRYGANFVSGSWVELDQFASNSGGYGDAVYLVATDNSVQTASGTQGSGSGEGWAAGVWAYKPAAGTPAGGVPANSTPPTISGGTVVGNTLTASPGTWTNNPSSFSYQWLRGGVAIAGATGSLYTTTQADIGSTIAVTVTAHNSTGTSNSVTSASTTAIMASGGSTNPHAPINWGPLAFESIFSGGNFPSSQWTIESGNARNSATMDPAFCQMLLANHPDAHGFDCVAMVYDPSSNHGAEIVTNNIFAVGDYIEALVYFPGSSNASSSSYNWGAWWTSGPNWPAAGEIDIVESLGGGISSNYHGSSNSLNGPAGNGLPAPLQNMCNQWFVAGVLRTANRDYVYWTPAAGNGTTTKVWDVATGDNGVAENILLNSGNGSRDLGGTPGSVRCAWVRMWSGCSLASGGGGGGGGGVGTGVPTVTTQAATGVSAIGATLNASVNPNGVATSVYFNYGPTTAYGSSTPPQSIGSGVGAVAVSAAVTGLTAGQTYHFQAVATY